LASKAGFYLSLLHEFAVEGDAAALGELSEMLGDAIQHLNDLPPEFVRQVSRHRMHWPVLAGQHPLQNKGVQRELAALQVGEATEWRKHARWGVGWGGRMNTASKEAICLVGLLQANAARGREVSKISKADWQNWPRWAKACRTLPPLAKDTADKWFAVGWQAILDETNGRPETIPALFEIGSHRAEHSKRTGQQNKTTPRTAAANIREGIKERIRQAIHSMARNPSR